MPAPDRSAGEAAAPRAGVGESLCGLDPAATATLLAGEGEPPYRARQLFAWVHARGATGYAAMTDLAARTRDALAARLPVRCTAIAATHPGGDGTTKLLVGLADGESVECVLIPENERRTACISTQVGCGVGCIFCASGADGVVRNLTAAEIVEQAYWLRGLAGERLTNLVVMGMGEPLHNVGALLDALAILQDPQGMDLGARRITLSTSGPERGFEQLLAAAPRINLALSLHAATDGLRRRLVPRGGTASVEGIRAMARRWFESTGRDVTFEYVLLGGINDRDEDALALAALCGRHTNVNLIPMNPVPFAPALRAPDPLQTDRFADHLRRRGIVVHQRRQRGDDVAAACGQLRRARNPSG